MIIEISKCDNIQNDSININPNEFSTVESQPNETRIY